MYSVLNTLSEYTYFYISKNITSYTFVACFKNRRKPSVYLKISLESVSSDNIKSVSTYKFVWSYQNLN